MRSSRGGLEDRFIYGVDQDDYEEHVEYQGPEEIDEQEEEESELQQQKQQYFHHNGYNNSHHSDESFAEKLDHLTKSLDTQLQHTFDFGEEEEEDEEKLAIYETKRHPEDNFNAATAMTSDIHDFKENFSMESFREELDILTRSLDNGVDVDELINEAHKQVSSSSHPRKKNVIPSDPILLQVSGDKNVSFSEHTDVCTQSQTPITPNRRRIRQQPYATPTRSVSEHPPSPVKTPGFDDDTYNASPADARSVSSSVEMLLDRMRDTIERQDQHIQELERENEELRYQLHRLRTDRRSATRVGTDSSSTLFSPGTRFVAELARSIDLPQHQYGELARIMDKHYERVSEIRSRHGWD
jgi:hypothetical protein